MVAVKPAKRIILDQPLSKSDRSYFSFSAPQTVGSCENKPLVNESPAANPDREGLVLSLCLSLNDGGKQAVLSVA